MTRSLITRMVALLAVVVVGVWFVFIEVLQYRIGAQQFPVTVQAADAGGIYSGASVTYRGVSIGKVTSLGLTTTGVRIHLAINPGTKVPADLTANVRELSALGEQYLDLVPKTASGPYLHGGSVIPASEVTVPVPIGTSLIDFGSLLSSINTANLRTVEQFVITAFQGTGPALSTIITTGQSLFNALVDAQADNIDLISDGQPVLHSFEVTDDQFTTFNQGLASLTAQLDSSNADLSKLIQNGQAAEATTSPFLTQYSSAIQSTISSLATSSQVTLAEQPQVQRFFQILPVVAGELASSASGGQVRGELAINTDGTVCPYVAPSAIPSPMTKVATATLTNGCSSSAPDLLQRGFHG